MTKIEIEELRQNKALKEAALKKDMIILEKKKELYEKDKEDYERKVAALEEEKDSFKEWHTKIMWNRE